MCAHLNSPCVSGGVSSQQFAFGEADVGPRRPRNPPLSKQAASLAASSCHPSPPCLQRTRDHRVPGQTAAVPSSQAICRTCCTAQQSSRQVNQKRVAREEKDVSETVDSSHTKTCEWWWSAEHLLVGNLESLRPPVRGHVIGLRRRLEASDEQREHTNTQNTPTTSTTHTECCQVRSLHHHSTLSSLIIMHV